MAARDHPGERREDTMNSALPDSVAEHVRLAPDERAPGATSKVPLLARSTTHSQKKEKPMQSMAIEPMPVASLRPHPGNARGHSKTQSRQIADSIRHFGFTNPALIVQHDDLIA